MSPGNLTVARLSIYAALLGSEYVEADGGGGLR